MEEELNYLSIRRVFEKSNNQAGIDKLIGAYVESKKKFIGNTMADNDPVIEGVVLSKGFIEALSVNDAKKLAVAGAKPVDSLIEKVLEERGVTRSNIDNAIALFKEGLIDFDRLFDYICNNLKYGLYALKKITTNDDIFDKLTIENIGRIKKLILDYNAWDLIGKDYYEFLYVDYIRIALKVLERMPYDLDNVALAIKIREHKKRHDKRIKFNLNEGLIKDFILNYLAGAQDINVLLERLHARRDCLYLFNYAFPSIHYLFDTATLNKIIEELVAKMIKGEIKRPAFAMHVFDNLKERKIDIYNGWALNDRAVELDIYYMCDFKIPKPVCFSELDEKYKNDTFLEDFDELDGRYREALEEKEPEKPYVIKPTDGQGSNK